jgi:hypothetical protein
VKLLRIFQGVFLIVSAFIAGSLLLGKKTSEERNPNSSVCESSFDDVIIENEFQRLFSHCFGYTLIGAKPVSIDYCCRIEFSSNSVCRDKFFRKLHQTFDGSHRFLFKALHYSDFYSEVILIDLPALERQIKQNQYLTTFVKHKYGSVQRFIRALKQPELHIADCFKRDNIALGIVLGYGESNGHYYQRYLDVGTYLNKYPLICTLPFDPKPTPEAITEPAQSVFKSSRVPYQPYIPKKPAGLFASYEEEWAWMRSVRNKEHEETELPNLFQLPFFISKKGVETNRICQKYKKARNKLIALFSGKVFSEVVSKEVSKDNSQHEPTSLPTFQKRQHQRL